MTEEIILPPMSRRSLEIFFLLIDNFSDPLVHNHGNVISYGVFAAISPSFCKQHNIRTAVNVIKPILRMYGFYVTNVVGTGYMCHRSLLHTPDRFDSKFFGAKKIDRLKQ